MIILDEPFVSDFLLKTITDNKIRVLENPFSKRFITRKELFVGDREANHLINEQKELLYTNSENAIGWISEHLKGSGIPEKITLFKDKAKFRLMISSLFPDFYFKKVAFKALRDLDYSALPKSFVIKPNVGFFSLGVHTVESYDQWQAALQLLEDEIKNMNDIYPLQVMDATEFIIESYIEGDEFAIDCYFDHEGKPVVMNIMEHIFSSKQDVSDRLYCTSTEIVRKLIKKVELFLSKMNQTAKLKNFPLHLEIRIDNDQIIPIEGNPMRFGGWCTTPDLAFHAWGFNPYLYYFNQQKPNWEKILKREDDAIYSLILLANATGYTAKEIDYFNYDKVLSDFSNILELRRIDHHKFPIFGFLFTRTLKDKKEELNRILVSDLKEYVVLKK